jgi:hypothetical protein
MAAPTFIQEAETAWNSSATPKTTAAVNVLAGDLLVACVVGSEEDDVIALSNSGAGLPWVQQRIVALPSHTWASVWTTTLAANRTALSFIATRSGGSGYFGCNVLTFRGSGGVGASVGITGSAAPSLTITTTQATSAIVVVAGDWYARSGASRAWRTDAGALTEVTYYDSGGTRYTIYMGYHADAGAVGAYAVGLTMPNDQKYSMAAIEITSSVPAPPGEVGATMYTRGRAGA